MCETIRLLERSGLTGLQVPQSGQVATGDRTAGDPQDLAVFRGRNGKPQQMPKIVVYAGDVLPEAIPMGEDASEATHLLAGRHGPFGIVATLPPEHERLWTMLRDRPPSTAVSGGAPVSATRLGAVLANETLRTVTALHRWNAPGQGKARILHLLSDWDIRSESLTPVSPIRPLDDGRSRQLNTLQQRSMLNDWLGALQHEFDPDLGMLSWDDEAREPLFPLPHAALVATVTIGGESRRRRIVEWGLTPAEARLRALARALAEMAQGKDGGLIRITAAPDIETWSAKALCRAVFATRGLHRHIHDVAPLIEGGAKTDLAMMRRLARLYASEPLGLTLVQVGSLPAFRATATLPGVSAQATEPTAADALINASGRLLSHLQGCSSLVKSADTTHVSAKTAILTSAARAADLAAYGYVAAEVMVSGIVRRPGAVVTGYIQLSSQRA